MFKVKNKTKILETSKGENTKNIYKAISEYTGVLGKFRFYHTLPKIIIEILAFGIFIFSLIYLITFSNNDLKILLPILTVFILALTRISTQISLLSSSLMGVISNIQSLHLILNLAKREKH